MSSDPTDNVYEEAAIEETTRLLSTATDRPLSDEQAARLTELLTTSPAARDVYYRHIALETGLRFESVQTDEVLQPVGHALRNKQPQPTELAMGEAGRGSGSRGEERDAPDPARGARPTPRKQSLLQWASRHPKGPAVAIAATVLIAALVVLGLMPVKDWMARNEKRDTDRPTTSEFVAILNNSHKAKWLDGTQPTLSDPRLRIGRRLAISAGLIEVKYYTGAKVVIEGPAEFVVGGTEAQRQDNNSRGREPADKANSGFLKRGSLVARVEGKEAQGFTIDTPSARVEDLSTEFGVEVHRHGGADVIVLDGKVVLVRDESHGVGRQRMRLVKGQGATVRDAASSWVIASNAPRRRWRRLTRAIAGELADADGTRLALDEAVTVAVHGTPTDPRTMDAMAKMASNLVIRERGNGDEEQARLFLRFDISSIARDVTSATLNLRVVDKASNTAESAIHVARVTRSWDTSGSNFPLFSQPTSDVIRTNVDDDAPIGTRLRIDVTSIVRKWIHGEAENFGVVLFFEDDQFLAQAYGARDTPDAPTLSVVVREDDAQEDTVSEKTVPENEIPDQKEDAEPAPS